MSESVMKTSLFEKFPKFFWEMLVLQYNFIKVIGLTCKLDQTNQFRKLSREFFRNSRRTCFSNTCK